MASSPSVILFMHSAILTMPNTFKPIDLSRLKTYSITGHHEIVLPFISAGIIEQLK